MVAGMRNREEPLRSGAARRHRAAAWLTIAALFSLCLGQPLHASAPIAVANGSSQTATLAATNDLAPGQAPHDADLCSLCRATAQARLGVRLSACVGDLTASGACLPLQLPAPELASSAPDLRDAQPRAPPALPLLAA